jgi:hypothetical protein
LRNMEECESGRIGTLGKRVWGNSPWVRIPPPPQKCCGLHNALLVPTAEHQRREHTLPDPGEVCDASPAVIIGRRIKA